MVFCYSALLAQHTTFAFHGGAPGHALHKRGYQKLTLQRHFRASATFVHVESRFCGCKQQGEAAFCPSINPCVRRVCSKSVAVGIEPSTTWAISTCGVRVIL